MLRTSGWLISLLLITALQSVGVAQDETHCKNSTIEEAWGPEFASQARLFFVTVQKVVESNNSTKFSRLVHYPLRVNGTHAIKIANRSEFIRRYSSIITEDVRQAILAQTPECLFANGQGVMIGSGQVWFQQEPSGKMKIITINLP